MSCIWRMLTGLTLIALAYGWITGLGYRIEAFLIIIATPILGIQTFWVVLECTLERLAISRIPKLATRGSLIVCVVILLFLADENNRFVNVTYGVISMNGIIPALCLNMCICGVWVIFGPAMSMLAFQKKVESF